MKRQSRTTTWRHRTGRTKKCLPHGKVDYVAVAKFLSRRYFKDLWRCCPEDLLQEIELLAVEATARKRIRGLRKTYGNGSDRLGIVSFSRAAQARFHQVRKAYGLDRNKKFYTFKEEMGDINNGKRNCGNHQKHL